MTQELRNRTTQVRVLLCLSHSQECTPPDDVVMLASVVHNEIAIAARRNLNALLFRETRHWLERLACWSCSVSMGLFRRKNLFVYLSAFLCSRKSSALGSCTCFWELSKPACATLNLLSVLSLVICAYTTDAIHSHKDKTRALSRTTPTKKSAIACTLTSFVVLCLKFVQQVSGFLVDFPAMNPTV